jgi:protein-tyrosine kinase
MAERTTHLVERVAAQLRGNAGLAAPDPTVDATPLPTRAATAVAAAGAIVRPGDGVERPAAAPEAYASAAFAGDADPAETDIPDSAVLDMATLKRAGLALAGMRSRTTEEYRITVGRILRSLHGSTRGTPGMASLVMVTSARPGEGKSFSALNLGASIAQNGLADVLLVDVDGKPRSMTTLLGLRERQGLLDLVGGSALRPQDLVVRTAIEGFSVLPLGLNRSATAEGGVSRAVLAAIDRVRRRFPHHIVLLDTAPCLSTSDPSTLAPVVDQTIVVVEAGRTQRSELGAALELVRACPNVILVLNKVRLSHRHSFGSYYYFGYPS